MVLQERVGRMVSGCEGEHIPRDCRDKHEGRERRQQSPRLEAPISSLRSEPWSSPKREGALAILPLPLAGRPLQAAHLGSLVGFRLGSAMRDTGGWSGTEGGLVVPHPSSESLLAPLRPWLLLAGPSCMATA